MKEFPSINRARLEGTMEASARIGATADGGLHRLALSDQDKKMRDLFVQWLREADLDVKVDDLGNIYGYRPGSNKHLEPVVLGSHLDTQPNGGRFDGVLGVLSALEVVRTFNDRGIETERTIVVANFTNEEGARFEPSMLGSGGLSGVYDSEYIFSRQDRDGQTFGEELQRIGYKGKPDNRLKGIYRYVELHVEQGPYLESSGHSIGAVEGVQGIACLQVSVKGEQNHAGTTPMETRKDALVTAAKMIADLNRLARESDEGTKVTVGRMSVEPNVSNCVPGDVTFTVDIRHYDDEIRNRTIEMVKDRLGTLAGAEDVELEIELLWHTPSTAFAKDVVNLILEGAQYFRYPARTITSGAGHDAQHIHKMAPSAMIFVPSVHGKSHCAEEFTAMDDIEKGANTLLYVTYRLVGHAKP